MGKSVYECANAIEEISSLIDCRWTRDEWNKKVFHEDFKRLFPFVYRNKAVLHCKAWAELKYSEQIIEQYDSRMRVWEDLIWKVRDSIEGRTESLFAESQSADGQIYVECVDEFWEDKLDRKKVSVQIGETLRTWTRDLIKEANVSPEEADGPCGMNRWRYNGKIVDGNMTLTQWLLAQHLWQRLGQKVVIKDLIGKDNLFEYVHDDTVARHGVNINKWFTTHFVPLTVSSSKGEICMDLAKSSLRKKNSAGVP